MTEESNTGWQLGENVSRGPIKRRNRKRLRWVFLLFALSVLTIVGLVTRFTWQFYNTEAFPELAPGYYAGQFSAPESYGGEHEWVLHISDDYKKIEAVFLGSESVVRAVHRDGSGYLLVDEGDHSIALKGSSRDGDVYRGVFESGGTRRSGQWQLQATSIGDVSLDPSFKRWMLLRAEIAKIEGDIEVANQLIPAQKNEIDELSKVITDEGAMRERAKGRIKDLEEQQKLVAIELAKKKAEVAQAEAQLQLAQKVGVRGKLISISRESNEREARWVRSLLAGTFTTNGSDIESALARAEGVKKLREAVEIEKSLVQQLANQLGEKSEE